jgi:hypothetical protein
VGLLQQHARGGSQVPVGTVKSRLSRARAALLIGRDRDAPTTGRPAKGLPWRPLVANEWKASVQDERPLDPVVAAAQGERDGQPWRLIVYRSVHQPAGQPATTDRL